MLKTSILRHRKENKKKCTLQPFVERSDWAFFTYPKDTLSVPTNTLVLTLGAPPLTREDRACHLLLVDGTWRYATKMVEQTPLIGTLQPRSLPKGLITAYPRRQEDCSDPDVGLASIEALFAAYVILGWPHEELLDHYPFKEGFLAKNEAFFAPYL